MNIRYLGHACFLLESAAGIKVLTDPYDVTVGYKMPLINADIATVSHQHYDHNYIKSAGCECTVIKESGEYEVSGIKIKAVHTYHDDSEGSQRGENIVFKILIDGINVCHCGDLGHLLKQTQIDELGSVDILMLPVGGTYTIDAQQAVEVIKQLNPQVIIPMHYKTPELSFDIQGVETFIKIAGEGERLDCSEIHVTKDSLQRFNGIKVLNYK